MHDRKGLRVRSPAAEKETLMSIKLVVAVHFEGDSAQAVAVAFEAWDAPEPTRTFTSRIAHAEKKAARGTLDLRELPCILQLLREHALAPELIVIEGSSISTPRKPPASASICSMRWAAARP
jgi:deoxyinosine 3'endonuclease (endonuclease V)